MPNFIPYILNRPNDGYGCNMEQSGATVAINDLLASVHGHGPNTTLRILPGGWPAGEPVSFTNIRVRGAFTVSASAMGTRSGATLADVSITSLAGRPLVLLWAQEPSIRSSDGAIVPVEALG